MKEIWIDILGNSKYFISNYGRVKNKNNKIMEQFNDKNGYKILNLYYNGKHNTKKVHRLVAEAFLKKEDFKCMYYEKRNEIDLDELVVNHKDEIISNNNVDNLEWVTVAYNTNYGNARNKQKRKINKSVICIELNLELPSAKEMAKYIGVAHSSICDVCNGTRSRKTTGGYHFKWKEERKD